MPTTSTVKILISLPVSIKQYLEDLRRLDGVTVSGYIRQKLERDREARLESGWRPQDGWARLNTSTHQAKEAVRRRQAEKDSEQYILQAARKILARQESTPQTRRTARPTPKKGGRP